MAAVRRGVGWYAGQISKSVAIFLPLKKERYALAYFDRSHHEAAPHPERMKSGPDLL